MFKAAFSAARLACSGELNAHTAKSLVEEGDFGFPNSIRGVTKIYQTEFRCHNLFLAIETHPKLTRPLLV